MREMIREKSECVFNR